MNTSIYLFFSFFALLAPFNSEAITDEPEFENLLDLSLKERAVKNRLRNKTLLITGCARSGTTFITKFFQLNGYDMRHEREGHFGVVSWPMTADSKRTPWGPGYDRYLFKHIFHQVRHPLKTIASAETEPQRSWTFIKQFVPEINLDDPKVVKAAKYWYYWNLLAESKAEWRYRIEDIENQIDMIISLLGCDLEVTKLKDIPTNTNTRGRTNVYSWQDLKEKIDDELFTNIVEMASRYGYEDVPTL